LLSDRECEDRHVPLWFLTMAREITNMKCCVNKKITILQHFASNDVIAVRQQLRYPRLCRAIGAVLVTKRSFRGAFAK
jgi:hypothetical protein